MTAGANHGRRGRLAVLAGGGVLPFHVANAARRNGEDPVIIALAAESDRTWPDFEHVAIGTGDFAGLERALDHYGIDRVVLSGWVWRRPEWRELRPTFRTLMRLPGVVATLLRGGDDKVLRMVIGLIEGTGRQVVGAHAIAPDLLAEPGCLTQTVPDAEARRDIMIAREAALALGRLDIGQGAVAVGGRVVALEGPEGTDAMLERVVQLRGNGRISTRRRGVLVKFCKPGQDERADLPAIGPATIPLLKAAGLSGVATEVGRSLVLERERTVAAADTASLFIIGIPREEEIDGV